MNKPGSETIANPFLKTEKKSVYVLPKDRVPEQSFETNFPELGVVKPVTLTNIKPKMAWNKILTQTVQPEPEVEAVSDGKKGRVIEMVEVDEPKETYKPKLPNLQKHLERVETKQRNERFKYDHLFGPPTPEESETEDDAEYYDYDDSGENSGDDADSTGIYDDD